MSNGKGKLVYYSYSFGEENFYVYHKKKGEKISIIIEGDFLGIS